LFNFTFLSLKSCRGLFDRAARIEQHPSQQFASQVWGTDALAASYNLVSRTSGANPMARYFCFGKRCRHCHKCISSPDPKFWATPGEKSKKQAVDQFVEQGVYCPMQL
jgi:hypothetical protein